MKNIKAYLNKLYINIIVCERSISNILMFGLENLRKQILMKQSKNYLIS